LLKERNLFPEFKFSAQAFDREADNVAEGTGDRFNDFISTFLNGVGAGLVEGIDLREVFADLAGAERAKGDVGGLGEKFLAMAAQVDETDAGDNAMGATLQLLEHAVGVLEVGRFAEKGGFEGDEGVGAEDEGVGEFFGDGAGLAIGVELGNFRGGQLFGMNFRGVAGNDGEGEAEGAQQFRAAGGIGGKNERRQVHGQRAMAASPKAARNASSLAAKSASESTGRAFSTGTSWSSSTQDLQPA